MMNRTFEIEFYEEDGIQFMRIDTEDKHQETCIADDISTIKDVIMGKICECIDEEGLE